MPTIRDVLHHQSQTAFANALDHYLAAREAVVGFDSLEEEARFARCVLELEREVADGGFAQYFASDAGGHALEAVSALQSIGAGETAALLRQALTIFPRRTPPADIEEREDIVSNLDEGESSLLGRLDSLFFDTDESLIALLRAYVEESLDAFENAE